MIIKIVIAIAILAALYGLACIIAERNRKLSLKRREDQAIKDEADKIEAIRIAAETQAVICFDHGYSLVPCALVRKAENGVFWYVTEDTVRRASYDMVSCVAGVDVSFEVRERLESQYRQATFAS